MNQRDKELLEKTKYYIASFLEAYNKKAESSFSDLFDKIKKINRRPEDFFPFYKREIGKDFSVMVFIANKYTVFYIIKHKSKEPIKIVDKSQDTYYESDDWIHFSSQDTKKTKILKELGIITDDIIDEIIYGGLDYFSRDYEGIKRDAISVAIDRCGDTKGIGTWMLVDYAEREFENRNIVDNIKSQYQKINAMEYSSNKGIEFQNFIFEYLNKHGSNPKNIRTTTDEIDIFLKITNFPVLIECRYQKNPIEAKEIRDFYGKLSGRPPITIGVFIAPNGFSKGAIEEIKEKLQSRLIITIDKNELDDIIQQKGHSIELLNGLTNDLVYLIEKKIFEISGKKSEY